MTAEEMIAFEKEIAADFEAGKIAAPVHLAGGNEAALIHAFKDIDKENDWVCCAWRSHYHCLLKGVSPTKLKEAIHAGRSINLNFPEHKVISSAIVGGICPIAMGIAWTIKREGFPGKVWVFIGDMTSASGIASECMRYSIGHNLPIQFIIEDNNRSVCTPTWEVWGKEKDVTKISGYAYDLTWPHVGVGRWVKF